MQSHVTIKLNPQYNDFYQHHLKEIMKGNVLAWYTKNNQRKNIPNYTLDDGEQVAYFYADKITELQDIGNTKEIIGKLADKSVCEFWILALLNKYLLNPFTLPTVKVNTLSIHENYENKDSVYDLVQDILMEHNGFELKKEGDFKRFVQGELDKVFTIEDSAGDIQDIMKQEYTIDTLFEDTTIPTVEYLQNLGACDKNNMLNCVKVFFMQHNCCVSDVVSMYKKDNKLFLRKLKERYGKQMQTYHADRNQNIDEDKMTLFDDITKKYTTSYSALKKYLQEK